MQFPMGFFNWLFTHQDIISNYFYLIHGLLIFISRRRTPRFYIVFPSMPWTGYVCAIIFILHQTQSQWSCFMKTRIRDSRYFVIKMEQRYFMRSNLYDFL